MTEYVFWSAISDPESWEPAADAGVTTLSYDVEKSLRDGEVSWEEVIQVWERLMFGPTDGSS